MNRKGLLINQYLLSCSYCSTAIIRYLGSRFQETMQATDEDNRTALHYAAVIKDNGHFYNLLIHLGANPKDVDNVSFNQAFHL